MTVGHKIQTLPANWKKPRIQSGHSPQRKHCYNGDLVSTVNGGRHDPENL